MLFRFGDASWRAGALFVGQHLLGGGMKPELGDSLGIRLDDLELPAALMFEALAGLRHMAGKHEGEPAKGIDIAVDFAQARIDRLGDVLQLGTSIGIPAAALYRHQQRGRRLVMLVLDLADDLLDEVLDGEQSVGATELVDDQRHVRALAPHVEQHVEHRQGGRHEHDAAENVAQVELLRRAPVGEHVLDVDHADDGIEFLAIDRQAAMAGLLEQLHQIGEAGVFVHGDDVRPRHADIAGIALPEVEQVAQHLALDGRKVADRAPAALVLMLVDRILDAVPQRFFVVVTEQQGADAAPYSATFVAVSIAVATGALGHVRCSVLAYQIGVVQAERRERDLRDLMKKGRRPVVLVVDEAHDLHHKTLTGLKRLMEVVADAGVLLSVLLVGHPRLRNDLRRPQMEEIGYRTTIFDYEGIGADKRRGYVAWLLGACAAEGVKVADLMDEDAVDMLAERLRTPLQIEMHLTLAFEQGFRLDAKPVTADIVEQVLSRAIDDLEPTLTRNGYDATAIAQQFNAKLSEVRAFLAGSLDPDRGRELTEQLRQAGVPV